MGTYRTHKIILLQLVVLYLLVGGSCTRRELDPLPTEGKVKLSFDWKKLLTGDASPAHMKLYFYGSDGSVISADCSGSGFEGTLPTGTYQVLAYNTDGSQIAFRNQDSYANTQAYVLPRTRADYIEQPFFFYGMAIPEFTVSPGQTSNAPVAPAPLCRKAVVQFAVTGRVEQVASMQCTLSGLAQFINVSSGQAVGQDGTITFTPQLLEGTSNYQATIGFFGALTTSTNTLTVEIGFTDGSSQTLELNVSEAMQHSDSSVVISANVDVDIRGDVQPGFTAVIKGWNYAEEGTDVE